MQKMIELSKKEETIFLAHGQVLEGLFHIIHRTNTNCQQPLLSLLWYRMHLQKLWEKK